MLFYSCFNKDQWLVAAHCWKSRWLKLPSCRCTSSHWAPPGRSRGLFIACSLPGTTSSMSQLREVSKCWCSKASKTSGPKSNVRFVNGRGFLNEKGAQIWKFVTATDRRSSSSPSSGSSSASSTNYLPWAKKTPFSSKTCKAMHAVYSSFWFFLIAVVIVAVVILVFPTGTVWQAISSSQLCETALWCARSTTRADSCLRSPPSALPCSKKERALARAR